MMGVSDKYHSEMCSSACVLVRGHHSSITMNNHDGLKTTTHDNSDMIIGSDANYNIIMA